LVAVRAESGAAAGSASSKLRFDVPANREADDLARFLAGMPAREGSSFAGLQSTPEWAEHAKESDRLWGTFDTKRLQALRAFSRDELAAFGNGDPPVFYPFGGPDALHATVFFPSHSVYVLVGLEPPGTLTPARRFKEETLAEKLSQIRTTLNSLLPRSFFVTREMDKELRGQVTDGTLPVILVELVRSGARITGFEYVTVDEQGALVARTGPPEARGKNRGVALEFENEADHSKHQLLYFSVNLDDAHLAADPQFFQWLNSGAPVVTFFKSTSYMTHQKTFSRIRNEVLDHSLAVLQDDSGIPYHFFKERNFRVQLYGEYDRPYGSFRYLAQPDLKKAYMEPGVKTLAFRIGYGYGRVPSNLQLATPGK
jgi:hypothetical protein